MLKCDKCDKYLVTQFDIKHHNCKKFIIYDPYEDCSFEKYGINDEYVIEKIAIDRNSDDPILNDNIFELPIKITDVTGVEKWFNVYAEHEINYYPKEVEAPSKEELDKLN